MKYIDPILIFLFIATSTWMILRSIWKMKQSARRLEAWSKRDQELSDMFLEALDNNDIESAERLRYAITKNYEGWLNQDK